MHHVCRATDADLIAVNANNRVPFLQIHFGLLLEQLVDVRPYHMVVSKRIRGVHARDNLWEQATLEAALTGNLLIRGNYDDRSGWVVLGNTASGTATVTECDDELAFEFKGRFDSGRADTFLDGKRRFKRLGVINLFLEQSTVVERGFCFYANVVHHCNTLERPRAFGRFAAQHDAISTVANSIGDISNLSAGGARVLDHRFQHLSRNNDNFARCVALLKHHFLSKENLGKRNFNSEIATSDHDAVTNSQNLIEVIEALLTFNLGNHLNLWSTLLGKQVFDQRHVSCSANEGESNEINTLLHTKKNVLNVLFANCREINRLAGQVAALGIAELAVVSDSAMTVCSAGTQTPVQQLSMCSAPGNKVVAFDGDDFQPDEAIIN